MVRINVSKQILIVEDEIEIRDLMILVLKRQGFQVSAFSSVEEFQQSEFYKNSSPLDLLILDWMLPGMSGFDFLKQCRKKLEWKALPIIMVTAKAEPEEVVQGLESGADDYLIKPFDTSVLLARVRAHLRREQNKRENLNQNQNQIQWNTLNINTDSYEVTLEGEKLSLTPTEYKLLLIMVQNSGKVFTREQLVQSVQGEGVNVIGRTVDTHIFSLRKKLKQMGDFIETARGVGYRFRDLDEVQ